MEQRMKSTPPLSQKQRQKLLQTAIRAAKEAGAIQRRGLGKTHSIEFKGEINLVTEVDKACEAKIIRILSKDFPTHDFLGEESGTKETGSEFKWIIDPLDGTTNYAHAYPLFCVSIGLEYRGEIILGVVYEPNMDQLFTGERGGGAKRNGKKISVSKTKILKQSMLGTGFAYNVQTPDLKDTNVDRFTRFLMNAQAIRRDGVAAIDLCYVAWGRYDGFWEKDLYPWDTAAGLVILEEAGGKITKFDGSPYRVYDKEILVSNGRIHDQMLEVVQWKKR